MVMTTSCREFYQTQSTTPIGKPGEEIYRCVLWETKLYSPLSNELDTIICARFRGSLQPQGCWSIEVPAIFKLSVSMEQLITLLGVRSSKVSAAKYSDRGYSAWSSCYPEGHENQFGLSVNESATNRINSASLWPALIPQLSMWLSGLVLFFNTAGAINFAYTSGGVGQSECLKWLMVGEIEFATVGRCDTTAVKSTACKNKQIQVLIRIFIFIRDDRSVIHGEHGFFISMAIR